MLVIAASGQGYRLHRVAWAVSSRRFVMCIIPRWVVSFSIYKTGVGPFSLLIVDCYPLMCSPCQGSSGSSYHTVDLCELSSTLHYTGACAKRRFQQPDRCGLRGVPRLNGACMMIRCSVMMKALKSINRAHGESEGQFLGTKGKSKDEPQAVKAIATV